MAWLVRSFRGVRRSLGFRFPPEVVAWAVRWYLRFGLSYRTVEELGLGRVRRHGCQRFNAGRDDWNAARDHAGLATSGHADMHGGELETSILLHACPELVRDSHTRADHDAEHRPHLLVTGMRAYTDTGIIGRPSTATAEKGSAVVDSLTTSFADHLKMLG